MEKDELVGQSEDNNKPTENIFYTLDGLVRDQNRIKKMLLIMI
jgi:hypothetical protein